MINIMVITNNDNTTTYTYHYNAKHNDHRLPLYTAPVGRSMAEFIEEFRGN